MKKLIAFLALACGLAAAPTTPINNANIQLNGVSQTGVLAGNTTGAATATQAQISAAIDLLGSTRGSVLYKGASGWTILTPGTVGQTLTTGGAGADPSWTSDAGGSVVSVSAGNLSPLFTTNVANPTTTPSITFTLSDAAANRFFAGPASGPNAPPTFRAIAAADIPAITTGAFILKGDGSGGFANTDMTYATPILTVVDGFGITSAGSIALNAGGSAKTVTITPKGSGSYTSVFTFDGVEALFGTGAGLTLVTTGGAASPSFNSVAYGGGGVINLATAQGTESAPANATANTSQLSVFARAYANGAFRVIGKQYFVTGINFGNASYESRWAVETVRSGQTARSTALSIDEAGLFSVNGNMAVLDGFTMTSAGSIALTAGGTSNIVLNATNGKSVIVSGITNFNTIPTGATGRALEISGTAAINAAGFGPQIEGRRFGGTFASPTAVTSGQTLINVGGSGMRATTFSAFAANISFTAAENWTDSTNAAAINFGVSSLGSTSISNRMTLQPWGGLQILAVSSAAPAWGVTGVKFNIAAQTTTDSSSSGTVASATATAIGVQTFAASSATVFTKAAGLYIAGDVAAGTNVTFGTTGDSGSYGLWNEGKTLLRAAVNVSTVGAPGITQYRANTSFSSPSNLTDGQSFLNLTGIGYGATGYASGGRANIQALASGTWTDTQQASFLILNFVPTQSADNSTLAAGLTLGRTGWAEFNSGSVSFSRTDWSTNGVGLIFQPMTFNNSTSTGTVASMVIHSIRTPTVTATSSSTFTNAATLYIASAPTASTNVTITNNWALWSVGNARFDVGGNGKLTINTATTSNDYSELQFTNTTVFGTSSAYLRAVRTASSGSPTQIEFGTMISGTIATRMTLNHYGQLALVPTGISIAAWGTTGILTSRAGATITDSSTAGSGTAASAVFHSFAVPTLAATNASVTTTVAANVYIAGEVTQGTNQTIGTSYGLWNVGKMRQDSRLDMTSTSGTSAAGILFGADTTLYRKVAGQLVFSSAASNTSFMMEKTNAGSDEKLWDALVSSTQWRFRTVNDANSTANNWLTVTRSGTSISSIVLATSAGTTAVTIDSSQNTTLAGTLTTLGGATFHTTSTALTDGAGASSATLTNAPSAGNPTKWIQINDNGTTRKIPTWQ